MQESMAQLRAPPSFKIMPFRHTEIVIISPQKKHQSQSEDSEPEQITKRYNKASQKGIRKHAKLQSQIKVINLYQQSDTQAESQASSMRKLYDGTSRRQLIKQKSPQEEISFLYESSRGEQQSSSKVQKSLQLEQSSEQQEEIDKRPRLTWLFLIQQPIQKGKMVQCVIKQPEGSFLSLERSIQLYLSKEKKLLLRAIKSKLGVSAYYQIVMINSNKRQVIGFIESNLSRTQYKYSTVQKEQQNRSSKEEPAYKRDRSKSTYQSNLIKLNPIQVELSSIQSLERCYVIFKKNLLGNKQERMKLVIPRSKVYKSQRFSDIKSSYQNFQYDRLSIFQTKLAEKNKNGQLILDFKTKNAIQSTKNIILENQNGQICLTFYKRKKGIYIMNVINPLTILNAFFIAVSNIDHFFI